MALNFPSLDEVSAKIAGATRRFPMALLTAVIGTLLIYWMIENGRHEDLIKKAFRFVAAISLGLPLFVGLAVFSEKRAHPQGLKWGLQLLGLPVLAFAWWAIDPGNAFREMHSLVWYVGLSFLFHLFVSFAAFLKKGDSVLDFWEFNKQLFVNFLSGAVYCGVILVGLAIAIVAADKLFHIHFGDKIWGYLFSTVLGLFQTVYFLSNFPADFEFDHTEIRYELVVKNLVKWILIPIVGLYFLILYAYSGKILATWQLPIGWVSWLMVGFSVAGIFTWLMNFMLPRIDGAGIIVFFKKWFWPVLAPMLMLLFVAVGRRIKDYGITEDRYLIAHLGMWLALMAAYFIFSKKDDIRAIPVSLAVFTIIYLMPGIGGMDAGVRAQTKILTQLLEKNGLLRDGKMVAHGPKFKGDDSFRIQNILNFLARRDAIGPVAAWTGKPDPDFKKDGNSWAAATKLMEEMGIAENLNSRDGEMERNYYRPNSLGEQAVPIGGFDSLLMVEIREEGERTGNYRILVLGDDGHSLVFDGETNDIQSILDKLWEKPTESATLDSIGHIDLLGKTLTGRLIPNNLDLKKTDGGARLQSGGGWLLSKKN